jgi:CheY-like chemotaxis protein
MSDRWEDVRSILLVGFEPASVESLRAALTPPTVLLTTAASAAAALDLLPVRRFDAIVVAFPLPNGDLSGFLEAVRRRRSPWRSSAVVLLAPAALRHEAIVYMGRGANRVVALDEAESELAGVLERLFRVAPRVEIRAIGRVEVVGRGTPRRFYCQTGNVSASGMLLRVPSRYPPSTELAFELFLPGDLEPVRGRAEVVRHANPPREPHEGVGVTFSEFTGRDETRLRTHLKRVLP